MLKKKIILWAICSIIIATNFSLLSFLVADRYEMHRERARLQAKTEADAREDEKKQAKEDGIKQGVQEALQTIKMTIEKDGKISIPMQNKDGKVEQLVLQEKK